MTGRIVFEPAPAESLGHQCAPPHAAEGQRPNPSVPSGGYSLPQSDWEAGTVWACDCDRTWVTRHGRWHPERRFARWRRERRLLKDRLDGIDLVLQPKVDPDTRLSVVANAIGYEMLRHDRQVYGGSLGVEEITITNEEATRCRAAAQRVLDHLATFDAQPHPPKGAE